MSNIIYFFMINFLLSIFWRTLIILVFIGLAFYWYKTPDKVFMDNYNLEMPKLENEEIDKKVESKNFISEVKAKKVENSKLPEKKKIGQKVPFLVQAPSAQWDDEHYQDACEEASMLIANLWLKDQDAPSKSETEKMLEELFEAEKSFFGDSLDISATDTAKFFQEHFKHSVSVVENVTLFDLYNFLEKGNIVIAPMDGRKLNNSYFSGGGPERHMLVITGYDLENKEFIVNDPGFRKGEEYRYKVDVLYNAIRDYETGNKKPISGIKKNVIVIKKN